MPEHVICCHFSTAHLHLTVQHLLQDVVRRYKEMHTSFEEFPDKVAFQLNDTHPTIGVAELMRILMDENDTGWTQAWDLTQKVRPASRWRQLGTALQALAVQLDVHRNVIWRCSSAHCRA